MILQQLGWSYGHPQQIQIVQKAVQLTTFCVKSINVVSFKKCYGICVLSCICNSIACPSITSSTASCLSATAKFLHFFDV